MYFFFLPGFLSRHHRALAKEFLPLLLDDLVSSQALVTVFDHLLPRGRVLALIHFGRLRLSCRSWKRLEFQIKSGFVTKCQTSNLERAILEPPPPTALTLLFGIFILLANRFLGFVTPLHLNHRLHSFLGFLGLLESPHGGRAPSFAAVLRLSWGQHLIYVSMGTTKTVLFNEASIDDDKIRPRNFIGPILIHIQRCNNLSVSCQLTQLISNLFGIA